VTPNYFVPGTSLAWAENAAEGNVLFEVTVENAAKLARNCRAISDEAGLLVWACLREPLANMPAPEEGDEAKAPVFESLRFCLFDAWELWEKLYKEEMMRKAGY
jgi:hypothetical protein